MTDARCGHYLEAIAEAVRVIADEHVPLRGPCRTCRYWVEATPNDVAATALGECRRHAPVLVNVTANYRDDRRQRVFPETIAVDSCGDWNDKGHRP